MLLPIASVRRSVWHSANNAVGLAMHITWSNSTIG